VLPREDAETLSLCKRMMEQGEWPPLLVVFDPVEGLVALSTNSLLISELVLQNPSGTDDDCVEISRTDSRSRQTGTSRT
uniref:Uncharacterized protein n=1 Tax=Aegilops tauschii subsp. strangulata TaxID=200361 RepID=A0A453N024_AEGTS